MTIYYFRIHFQHSMPAQEAVELRFLRTVICQAENKLFVLHYSRLRRALFWGLMPLFEPADCFYFYFYFYQELKGETEAVGGIRAKVPSPVRYVAAVGVGAPAATANHP